MRDDLSGLRALLCVAEKRSFRAAAAELRVTPSAVSQIVRALEERVGVRLLQRTTRNVGLTEAGVHFIAQRAARPPLGPPTPDDAPDRLLRRPQAKAGELPRRVSRHPHRPLSRRSS